MGNVRLVLVLCVAFLLAAFGFYAQLAGVHSPVTRLMLFGLSILGAAFLLSWATEVAQLDVPRSMAFALLALIAIIPEYAVDIYFSWTAASNAEYVHYAAANMTGANRLLIGLGWALVVFVYWLKHRKREIALRESERVELSFLFFASLYAFIIVLKRSFSLVDTLLLGSLFVLYMVRVSRTHKEEPHLIGPAALVGSFGTLRRRAFTVLMLAVAAAAILISAEPFAESLLEAGSAAGIDRFLLVQWLAPLASEAPEFVIALLFVMRNLPRAGFETLLSSKINQWTLLIATIPLAYSIALGAPGTMHLDQRQSEELFLTAAQSLFAMAVMLDLRITLVGAAALFVLFFAQFLVPQSHMALSFVYLALAGYLFYRDRTHIVPLLKGIVR